jgi:alkylation response protein AidB-like acyl-CoA dehydrogenase
MDLMPTPEQDAIRDSVRAFLDKELPMSRVRALLDAPAGAYDAPWRAASALGFFALGLPEAQGGAGYGITEEMVLFEELGRALAPGPWLGTVLAAHALVGADDAAARRALERIVAGELRVALCIDAWGDPLALTNGRLSGTRRSVLGVGLAEAFLVVDRSHVMLVPKDNTVAVTPVPSLDATNPVGTVDFRQSPVSRLPSAVSPHELVRAATVLSCAEAVGGIARTVEMSVEYAKVRQQFGKPIGSFQAVKHRCADMAVRAEVARSATIYATVAVRDAAADADFQASVAKVLCANAYLQNTADNIQNHGGIGFTWECDAHFYAKRARAFDATVGSRRTHLDALVRQFRTEGTRAGD